MVMNVYSVYEVSNLLGFNPNTMYSWNQKGYFNPVVTSAIISNRERKVLGYKESDLPQLIVFSELLSMGIRGEFLGKTFGQVHSMFKKYDMSSQDTLHIFIDMKGNPKAILEYNELPFTCPMTISFSMTAIRLKVNDFVNRYTKSVV